MPSTRRPSVAPWVLMLAFAGAMSALAGGYWDDAWHTERGRDAFLIAPHIAIYAGIAVVGAALTLWALMTTRTHGVRGMSEHKPLVLATLGVGVTLVSAPIDNAWHIAFGRDAVIWSPPHMLGIAGTTALGAALLAELAGRREAWARSATVVAGALVLASAGFVVVEYDTDVPQFDTVYYLPALGFAVSVALVLVRTAADGRWAATASAAVYTAFIALVGGFLSLGGFAAPALPLLVVPAIVVDVAARRRWSPILTSTVWTVALHVAYVPVRNLLGDGVRFDAADVAIGAGLTWTAAVAVFTIATGQDSWRHPLVRAGSASYAAMLLALLLAPGAMAHDPGQGEDAGALGMVVKVSDGRAHLTADMPITTCDSTEPLAVVARRAGRVARGSLSKRGCRLLGAVTLPSRGRWFVYATFRRQGRTAESWLPVARVDGSTEVADGQRYAYFPAARSGSTVEIVSGIVLYAAMLALLFATYALVRSSRPRPRNSYAVSEGK